MSARLGTYFNVHLVSDSTGETLAGVVKACFAQFDDILPLEHAYYLVRSQGKLEQAGRDIAETPGVVMFTLSNMEHRAWLETHCAKLGLPCVAVLDAPLSVLSRYLGQGLNRRVGGARFLNAEYFRRIDALDFAMYHDDGQAPAHLLEADVILVGVSRTSKTPTSVYLAHRGVKAANVPLVPKVPPPAALFESKALKVGLTISAERLVHIRRNRLMALNEERPSQYTDVDDVKREIMEAQKMFARYEWPVIDVTRRSIEETAAAILDMLSAREET